MTNEVQAGYDYNFPESAPDRGLAISTYVAVGSVGVMSGAAGAALAEESLFPDAVQDREAARAQLEAAQTVAETRTAERAVVQDDMEFAGYIAGGAGIGLIGAFVLTAVVDKIYQRFQKN